MMPRVSCLRVFTQDSLVIYKNTAMHAFAIDYATLLFVQLLTSAPFPVVLCKTADGVNDCFVCWFAVGLCLTVGLVSQVSGLLHVQPLLIRQHLC